MSRPHVIKTMDVTTSPVAVPFDLQPPHIAALSYHRFHITGADVTVTIRIGGRDFPTVLKAGSHLGEFSGIESITLQSASTSSVVYTGE